MSTFPGKLDELPDVSIDRFDKDNLRSKAFFLSHFHSDHMEGLWSHAMRRVLAEQDNVFLYCSEITAMFLSHNHLKGLDHKVRWLPLNKPYTVNISGRECVTVTALSAGHCPGSVMFLFQYKSLNILYTGDFRMTGRDVSKMKGLMDHNGGLIPIHSLYLDTTFHHPRYNYLPCRDESLDELIRLCRYWLDLGKNHIIDLRTPAYVGVEFALIELHKVFGEPFHVSDRMYEMYKRLPELAPAITKNEDSRFHVCIPGSTNNGAASFLRYHPKFTGCKIHSVKLYALSARFLSKGQKISHYSPSEDLHRIVYSSHSSRSELLEMIEILQPPKIVPCVVAKGETSDIVFESLVAQDQSLWSEEDVGNLSLSPFSSCEDIACNPEEQDTINTCSIKESEVQNEPVHPTLSKYNLRESSDEELSVDECDADELPPFRWDCYFDARKILGYHQNSNCTRKRKKVK